MVKSTELLISNYLISNNLISNLGDSAFNGTGHVAQSTEHRARGTDPPS